MLSDVRIKDTWIGFSPRNIVKQALAYHPFMASCITKEGLRGSELIFCLPSRLLACVILECFVNFLDDPYYEPLLWLMIYT